MSLPVPLSVRLVTGRADRLVTRDAHDITFRSTAPGGYASASVTLDRPLSIQPDEIDYFGRLVISDARSGAVVWDGQLEDPGRSAGLDGQVWQLTAIGPASHAHDRTAPLIYVDRRQAEFKASRFHRAPVDSAIIDTDTAPGIRIAVARSTVVTLGAIGDLAYLPVAVTGQKLARVRADWVCGFTNGSWTVELPTKSGVVGTEAITSATASTVGGTLAARLTTDTGNIVAGSDIVSVRLATVLNPATIADDAVWVKFSNIAVRTQLMTKAGADITTGYSADTVLASEVVADLLGRMLPRYDGAAVTIPTTTYAIDQLAYPDGVTPAKLFDDLMLLEPAYYWAAWERGANGKHRFEWTTWPTTVRYEADVTDGFYSPGAAADLYDSVQVRYLDGGQSRTTRRTQTVPALTSAGFSREGLLDLGDETGASLAQAQRAGDQWLAEHRSPPNAGGLVVARPIVDFVTGRMVQPWEVKPGALIRVRGVMPRTDALNPSGRDGVTIFKIVAATYRAATASVELELDSYPVSVSRALADLQSRPETRRR